MDAEKKPYVHLVDGGVADNLGLRALLERVIASGSILTNLKAANLEQVRKIAFIIVNAETEIDNKWDQSGTIPPFAAMFDSYSSIAIFRYNIETVALLRESFKRWTDEIREGTLSGRADLHGPRLLRGHRVLRRGSQVRRPEGPGRTDLLQAPAHFL